MGGSFGIVGSWRKRGSSSNGHLEPDGRKFRLSLAAGEKRRSSSNGHLKHDGGKFRNF